MAQNLSFVERELARVGKAASDAKIQMQLLEKALANVIIQGAKGSGAAGLSTGGVGVRNVAQRAMANPYMNPAGSPVGGRAIVGSGVDTAKIKGIAKEYDRLKPILARYNIQLELLQKAEAQQLANTQRLTDAKGQAADQIRAMATAETRIRTQQAAQIQGEAALRNQFISQNKSALAKRIAAYNREIAATKGLTTAEKKAETSLGKLAKGADTAASTLTRGGRGRAGGESRQERYTQQRLESVFAGRPGAAAKVTAVAGKAGFKAQDIKRVTEYANSYTQLQYAVQGANGVMRKLVLTTDRAGNVFTSTQKQFRSFFGAIRRNVTEMIKWSAATLVVWGAIRKLGELLEVAIENETKLASIAVILGEEHANLTQVFNSAAEAASATGESIDGVLEGYVQAYRATGNIADATERARQAQVLLTDALTLSKLSSMSTAQAMDTLTGALRQAGLGFEDGYILLDKWVAVSRAANVSIETLAESFAITATSASNAGLTWDELNGVIATLAESTTLSATESGNAIRAFIGGFSTDLAIKELGKFGIAVVDSTGETRGFLDVMKEVAAMFEQGIISEGELNKIARAIGGRGARRGAQVATTIKNLGRAQEVAEVSAKAHGDAQAALNIQLDTVQTSITKLSNSFQKLARAMGAEGGVLGVASGVLDIFTKLVDATASLVKNLGDMTPILAVMGGLFAATSAQSRGLFATNIAAGVGGLISRTGLGRGMAGYASVGAQRLASGAAGGFATGGAPALGLGGAVTNRMLQPGIGRNAGSMLGQGLAVGFTAVSAIRDLEQGNKAGAAGSIAGGIIGGLISGGSPIGIVIGTAAGEAFANATFNYKSEFTRFFSDIFDEVEPGKDPDDPTDREAATSAIFSELGFGSEGLGKFFAKTLSVAGNVGYQGAQVLGNVTGGFAIGDYQFGAGAPGAEITPEQIALFAGGGGEAAMSIYNIRAQEEALKGYQAEALPSGETFAVTDAQKKTLIEYAGVLEEIEATQAEIARSSALAGDITDKELRDALDQIPKLQSILTKYEVSFGEEIRRVNDDITDVAETFDYLTNIIVHGSAEQIQHLNAEAQALAELRNAIQLAIETGTGKVVLAIDLEETLEIDEGKVVNLTEAYKLLDDQMANVGTQTQAITRSINQARIDIPSIVTLDIREGDLDTVLAEAEGVQDKFWEGFWSEGILSDFSEADLEETLAPFMLQAGKDGGMQYVEGWNQSLLQQVAADLIERGVIKAPEKEGRRGLQTLDIASGQLPAVMARYQELIGITGEAGYVPDEETFAALFTDYIAMPITADLTLLNIAMQELIDVSKDQLDGIYNLPTDASFYVPFTGYQLGFVNQGGGGAAAGLPAGVAGTEEERRRGRPEGYVPSDIRGRLATTREPLEGYELGLADVGGRGGQPGREGARLRALTRGRRRGEEPFEGAQLERPDVVRQEFFEGLFGSFMDWIRPEAGGVDALGIPTDPETGVGGLLGELRDLLSGLFGASGEEPTITTKLQIESTTTTIVQLDGQVIANAIKPYLLNDEIRYEGTAGSAVKRFVI